MIPSANLAFHGFIGMGDQMAPANNKFATGCQHFIYWFPPLSFVSMGAWFKLVGYNLLMARWHTMLWGVILLAGLYHLVGKSVSLPKWVGVWAVLICALDYNFLNCSTARQDIMCAALGIWAIGTRNAWLSALACMVHPFGVMYAIVVAILKRKLDWLPYLVILACWSAYIAQAPDIWWQQVAGQMTDHVGMPMSSGAYLAFGTGWRLVLLVTYLACAVAVALRDRTIAICLALLVLPALLVPYASFYLPHAIPWLALCVAIQIRRYPWLSLIIIPQVAFVITSLINMWHLNGVTNLS